MNGTMVRSCGARCLLTRVPEQLPFHSIVSRRAIASDQRMIPLTQKRELCEQVARLEESDRTEADMFDYDPYAQLDPVPSFIVESDDLDPDLPLKAPQYGEAAGGSDTSPHLAWSEVPEGTKSFAVTAFDPDAPTGSGFWHWAVFNIPADVRTLPTGAGSPDSGALPAGAVTLPNELRQRSFTGATPPEGTGEHRYFFVVHAVDVESLEIDPESTPAVLGFNLHFHTLGRAILMGLGEYGGAS